MSTFEKTFDNTALTYDKSRPMYPTELYQDIFQYKQINAQSHVLEIGMGTGKATLPFLEKQCHFVGIEPGENLAAIAKEHFQGRSNFSLVTQTLQDYACPNQTFDLIYAATAFHWIPEEYGYQRVYNLLKSGGVFARFAYHAGADQKRTSLTAEIQEFYKKYMPSPGTYREFCGEDAKKLAGTAAKYGFADTKYQLYRLTKDFTAQEYMDLLKTYPNHMALVQPDREKLFRRIYSAINNSGGTITVYYTMDLELARKP